MFQKEKLLPDADAVYQLAGLTGVGWTASILAYACTVLGYWNWLPVPRIGEPELLLYLAGSLFLATVGLDYFRQTP